MSDETQKTYTHKDYLYWKERRDTAKREAEDYAKKYHKSENKAYHYKGLTAVWAVYAVVITIAVLFLLFGQVVGYALLVGFIVVLCMAVLLLIYGSVSGNIT